MNMQENDDEQLEIDVTLYADAENGPDDADLPGDADTVDLEPDETYANAIVNADDVMLDDSEEDAIAPSGEVEELSDSIEIIEEAPGETTVVDEEELAQTAARSRRRLRNVLIFFIILLMLIAAVLGIFIWKNSTPPNLKQADPDAMQISNAGTNTVAFASIEADQIPALVNYFGMTPEETVQASNNVISLDEQPASPAADESMPQLKSMRNAWVVSNAGDVAISITFGLNEQGKIMYTFATFDLDAYGVADAKFGELVANRIVAASVLAGVGIEQATVESAQLTITEKPDAITANDTSVKEIAEFGGTTARESAPKEWKLSETYDHTAGATLGDNSVIRTIDIDLR